MKIENNVNPQNEERQIIDGIEAIKSLCDEALAEVTSNGIMSTRVCDILAEEVQEISEGLFNIILNRNNPFIGYFNDAHADESKQSTSQ